MKTTALTLATALAVATAQANDPIEFDNNNDGRRRGRLLGNDLGVAVRSLFERLLGKWFLSSFWSGSCSGTF